MNENNNLIIEVSDKGIGISEQDMPKLFEAFHRGSNTNNISGTGLGLSIVKKAVDLMQGSIAIDSSINEGTCIKVILPIEG